MDFRKFSLILLLVTATVSAQAAELWTEIYNERLVAAKQGSAEAQFEVGAMLENGRGVTADRDQAKKWYQKAADQNYSRAVQAVARMKDNLRRLNMAEKQAEADDVEAQYKLGNMYLTGTGTPVDLKQSEQWLTRAAKKGHTKAQFKLAHLHYVELAEDGDLSAAFDWFNKAAESNYPPAYYYLGDMYATGSSVTRDYYKARIWYEKAREAGFSPALQALKELDERRGRETARLAAIAARPVPAAQPVTPVAKTETESKPAPEPTPPMDILERLQLSQWLDGRRPVQFLPSKVSDCSVTNSSLTCYSRELARRDLPHIYYKVKSIIRTTSNDSMRIVYRELVLQDSTVDMNAEDAELLLDTGIPPGWQEPHNLTCKFATNQQLSCTLDDGSTVKFSGA